MCTNQTPYFMKNLYNLLFSSKTIMVIILLIIFQHTKVDAQHLTLNVYSNQTEITATESITLIDGFHVPPGKNVRIFTAPSFKVCVPLTWVPDNGQNYVRSRTFKVSGVTFNNVDSARGTCEVNQTVQYVDGLGRALQNITVQGSPTFRDIVQPRAYDAFGREAKKYLPYVSSLATSNGSFKPSSLIDQQAYFNNPDVGVKVIDSAFSDRKFEISPVSRVIEQSSPGLAWKMGGGHTQKIEYGSNDNSTAYSATGFAVRLYSATPGGTGEEYRRTLSGTGYFDAGLLSLTISKDENWTSGKSGTTEEYKDKDDRVVLKRTFTATETISTYYVYDYLGNLSFVLPPGANPDATVVPDQNKLNNFCYQYQYDGKNRLIRKKIPGKGWEEMIYNPLDQLVFSQDTVQAQTTGSPYPYRNFIKYDAFGRVVMTGVEKDHTGTRAVVQDFVNNVTTGFWETRDNSVNNYHGYNNISCPWNTLNLEPEIVNYYDDYNIPGIPNNQGSSFSAKVKGLLTATKTKVLGTADNFLWTVNYYDDEGRMVKIWKQHYQGGAIVAGNYDEISNTYNFAGELTYSSRVHKVGAAITTIATRYEYDHMGRKKATIESINGQPEVVLSKLDYNEVGQLLKKDLHSSDNGTNFIQSNNYAYNERGWMTKINDPDNVTANKVFGMELIYANKADAYNGNIGAVRWQTKVPAGLGLTQHLQSFSYDYDKMNRLTKAGYTTSGSVDKFNEELTYDEMGNINSLKRKNAVSGYLNNLSYNYINSGIKSNRLMGVTDAGTAAQTSSYTYDGNGNQKTDSRKGISITYNHLNLPQTITKAGQSIVYTYDAAGNRLRKVFGANIRDYVSGIEYSNGSIEFIQTEEGRALPGTTYSHEYMLKDHLGNIRAMIKQNGEIIQVQDYYAFGMEMASGNTFNSSPNNLYKYNGKEKQDELGLDQLDYGARFYDPVIGRWNVVDPHNEKYFALSPYVYVADNPLIFIDPTGKDLVRIRVPDGKGGVKFEVVDSKIAELASKFAWKMYEMYGVVVTESYRTDDQQRNVSGSGGLKAKVGKSRHQQGFALDFGINAAMVKKKGHVATNEEKTEIGEYGESISEYEWAYGLQDYPHFELDAKDYEYDSFQDAYNTNKEDYKNKGGKDGLPIMQFSHETKQKKVGGEKASVITLTKEEIVEILEYLNKLKLKEKN
jgi:RHS repeat-associated protein